MRRLFIVQGNRSFTHIEHRATPVGREGLVPIFQSPGHPWIFTSVPKGFQSSLLLIHLRSQYLFKRHQRVAQNLSDRWCSTQVSRCSTIGAAQLRSVTEIAPKSPLLLWKEALSGLVFVSAQELSGYSVPQCAWDSTLVLRSLWCLSISVVLRYLDRALPCWVHPNCSVFWYFPHTSVSSFVFWVLEEIFLCRWKGEHWSLILFPSSSILNPPSFILVFQKTGELAQRTSVIFFFFFWGGGGGGQGSHPRAFPWLAWMTSEWERENVFILTLGLICD